MPRLLTVALLTATAALLPSSDTGAQSPTTFHVVYLGCLTEVDSKCVANGINNRRQIVGGSATSSGAWHAVLWEGEAITDLGALTSDEFSEAYGINSRGQIVGVRGTYRYDVGTSRYEGRAVLWENGTITDLGGLPGGSGAGVAYAINDRGQIVGASQSASGSFHPVLWERGAITDLGTIPGQPDFFGSAYGINNRGQIVGASGEYWVLWENGTILQTSFSESGVGAYGINNRGQIAGTSAGSGWARAFQWEDGTVTHLGPDGFPAESWAWAINARGEVVGMGSLAEYGPSGALLWENRTFTPILLYDGYSRAFGINAPGQIVGHVGWRAVLWTR